MQCTDGTEKSGSGTTKNWPTYHFMNNVTKDASGALLLEPAEALRLRAGAAPLQHFATDAAPVLCAGVGALLLLRLVWRSRTCRCIDSRSIPADTNDAERVLCCDTYGSHIPRTNAPDTFVP